MLHYAIVFFIIAIIAAVLGFSGLAAGAAGIAKILFVVFLVMAIATFVVNMLRVQLAVLLYRAIWKNRVWMPTAGRKPL